VHKLALKIIVSLLAIATAGPAAAQTQMTINPLPNQIEKRGLAVEFVEVARLPGAGRA
jgi:hypothetical protein